MSGATVGPERSQTGNENIGLLLRQNEGSCRRDQLVTAKRSLQQLRQRMTKEYVTVVFNNWDAIYLAIELMTVGSWLINLFVYFFI